MPTHSTTDTTGSGLRHITGISIAILLLILTAGQLFAADQGSVAAALELIRSQQFSQARQMLTDYTQRHPDELGARYWLGRAQLGEGDAATAIETFQHVLAAKPGSVDSRLWLAVALTRDGQVAAARREVDAVLAARPGDLVALDLDRRLPQPSQLDMGVVESGFSPLPPDHKGQVVLVTGGLSVAPGEVDILSGNLYDYTFGTAPVDWRVGNGTWESTSRWSCQPEWSWYGGYSSTGPAAIWTKREFVGDLVVELYAAFKHNFDVSGRPYKNPHDINITICGDGQNFDSGYTFMLGGENNTATQVLKRTRVLASTSDQQALLPIFENRSWGAYEFHRKWWGLRVSKRGNQLRFFVDNELVCEAQDPSPLGGGKVAIWTYDNGIVIPRVKIYYEHELSPRISSANQQPAAVSVAKVTVTSSSHPSLQNDFENGLGEWTPTDDQGAAQLAVVSGGPQSVGHCLKLTNPAAGGSFGAMIRRKPFDVTQMGLMSLDYRINPDVAVNFFLTINDRLYEIIFTGPADGVPHSQVIGRIRGVQADGKWHRVEFDLLAHLQEFLRQASEIPAHELFIGNLSNRDYLGAGFGANHAGAEYCLDNFALLSPSAVGTIKVAVAPTEANSVEDYAVTLDDSPQPTASSGAVALEDGEAQLEVPGTGTWYVHVYASASGDMRPVANYQVRVDQQPPRLSTQPPSGGQLPDGPITVTVSDPGGSGMDLSGIVVDVAGQRCELGHPAVDFDPQLGQLLIDPRLAGVVLRGGGALVMNLAGIVDRAGNALAEPVKLTYTFDADQDETAPLIRSVNLNTDYLYDVDFETDIGPVSPFGGHNGAFLFRDATTAASGQHSLRLVNPIEGGRFGIVLNDRPFNVGSYRCLAFDYKIPPRLRVDLVMVFADQRRAIKFTDVTSDLDIIGAIPDVRADDRWHHAEIDMHQLLRTSDPLRHDYQVQRLELADYGWLGNREGQTYHLDNIQLIPVVGRPEPLQLVWEALDLSGVAGLGWSFTKHQLGEVGQQITAANSPVLLDAAVVGNGWLNARFCDESGNWTETVSRRVLTDNAGPTVGGFQPAAGATAAPGEINAVLYDEGIADIDPDSIRLQVAGSQYTVDGSALVYNAQTHRLVWRCELVKPEPIVFANQQNVAVSIHEVSDFAGNTLAEPVRWTWRMDYSQDTQPPTVAQLYSLSHPTVACYTFEDDLGGVQADPKVTKLSRDSSTSATGSSSLKLTKLQGGRLAAMIHRQQFDALKYPVVAFDYKIPSGVKVGLLLRAHNRWFGYGLSGPVQNMIGTVPAVAADGRWHRAVVRLNIPTRGGQKTLMVDAVMLADNGPGANDTGATVHIDNLVIGRMGSGPCKVVWKATDPTGIAGYSWALDRTPNTAPGEAVETHQSSAEVDKLDPGLWFFHLRARDAQRGRQESACHMTKEIPESQALG